jgi:hypothetical protein
MFEASKASDRTPSNVGVVGGNCALSAEIQQQQQVDDVAEAFSCSEAFSCG